MRLGFKQSMACSRSPFRLRLQLALFGAGLLALSCSAGLWLYAAVEQRWHSARFDRVLQASPSKPVGTPADSMLSVDTAGAPVGRLEIPALNLSVMVFEGDGDSILARGAGHIPETAWPGVPGNAGIAAHRDTFFRRLEKVRVGDEVVLTTLAGPYCYRVQSIRVVGPDDVQVLASTATETLTLVTCYPFHYIGSAPYRFVVRAQRIES